jgi:hypothetical protein
MRRNTRHWRTLAKKDRVVRRQGLHAMSAPETEPGGVCFSCPFQYLTTMRSSDHRLTCALRALAGSAALLADRHRLRARLADLAPGGGTPATFQINASAYHGDNPYLTVRIHALFVGDVSTQEFCACLAGSWNGSSCAW